MILLGTKPLMEKRTERKEQPKVITRPRPHKREPNKVYDSLKQKLEDTIIKTETCWYQKCNTYKDMLHAYPLTEWKGQRYSCRQAVYTEFIGPIPAGTKVGVKCNNLGCLNPEHFELRDHLNPEIDTPIKRMLRLLVQGQPEECWIIKNRDLDKTPTIDFRTKDTPKGKRADIHLARPLAYEHFIGPVPEGKWVKTSCGYAGCLNPKHFCLGERKMAPLGTTGIRASSKKTLEEIVDIKRMLAQGISRSQIAAKHNVSWAFVYRIDMKQSYVNVKDD